MSSVPPIPTNLPLILPGKTKHAVIQNPYYRHSPSKSSTLYLPSFGTQKISSCWSMPLKTEFVHEQVEYVGMTRPFPWYHPLKMIALAPHPPLPPPYPTLRVGKKTHFEIQDTPPHLLAHYKETNKRINERTNRQTIKQSNAQYYTLKPAMPRLLTRAAFVLTANQHPSTVVNAHRCFCSKRTASHTSPP